MAKYLIAEEGLLKGQVFVLEDKEEYTIGRDPELADCVLNDPSVSRKHALLFKEDDGFCITDLSHTNPTIVNGESVVETHLLKEGDLLEIGKIFLRYTENKPENLSPQEPRIDLEKTDLEKQEEAETEQSGDMETIYDTGEELMSEKLPLSFDEEKDAQSAEEKQTEEAKGPDEEIAESEKNIREAFDEEKAMEEKEEEKLKKESLEEKNIESITSSPEANESPYDTIFEEETEEDFPFNIISENSLVLKVISGSNAGAEFGMDKGKSYIIGKDPSTCNILFNDLSVSKEHAKVTIEDDGSCYIEDLGSRNGIIVNSKKIDNRKLITSKDIIVLGSTVFVVIDPQEIQETIYAPMATAFEEAPKEKAEIVAEEELETEGQARNWRQLIIPRNHLIIAGSITIILFVMFLTFFSLFRSDKIEVVTKEPTEMIKHALEKFPGVQFSFNPAGGNLFLIGHVLTAIDLQELTYNIDNLGFIENIENNVIIDEYVWKNTNDLLNNNAPWRSVSVHSFSPGIFIASGYVQSPVQLEALSNYLKANFPYVDKLQNKVVIEDVLKTQIEGIIISRGMSAISYQLASGEVILAGRYASDDESSYEKLLEEIKRLDGVRSLKNAAIKTTPDMARIDLTGKYKITGVITSDHKTIISVVANNKLINIDGFLDGMKVTEIKPRSIYLEKDGLKYKIDYIR